MVGMYYRNDVIFRAFQHRMVDRIDVRFVSVEQQKGLMVASNPSFYKTTISFCLASASPHVQ